MATETTRRTASRNRQVTVLKIKEAVRERDGYRCCDCDLTDKAHYVRFGSILDVHRLVPGSVYTVKGCVTLCKPCHGRRHRILNGNDLSERRATKRKMITLLDDWDAFAAKLAAQRGQPKIWLLLDLMAKEADRLGITRPSLPWEKVA